MADKTPDQEPSIEEILASIRQIISDDERDDAAVTSPEPKEERPAPAQAAQAVRQPEAPPARPVPAVDDEDDILDLTTPIAEPVIDEDEEEIAFTVPDEPLPPLSRPSVEPPPAPRAARPVPEPGPQPRADTGPAPVSLMTDMISEEARRAALHSMSRLTGTMPVSRPRDGASITLEDLVRDILNPLLRDWLSDNLPPMVERIVQKEMEKLARQAQDV